jgi:hypothetical protein
MEQNNKTLILAFVILLIAIVSFNFTGMTGEAVRVTSVTLDKTYALPSETITLNIVPGIKGVYEDIDVYNADTDYRYMQSAATVCRSSKCTDTSEVKFKLIDSFEPGTYYFRVYDLYSKNYVKAYFTVGVLYQPIGPKEHY